jgi:hypothetical protein
MCYVLLNEVIKPAKNHHYSILNAKSDNKNIEHPEKGRQGKYIQPNRSHPFL